MGPLAVSRVVLNAAGLRCCRSGWGTRLTITNPIGLVDAIRLRTLKLGRASFLAVSSRKRRGRQQRLGLLDLSRRQTLIQTQARTPTTATRTISGMTRLASESISTTGKPV